MRGKRLRLLIGGIAAAVVIALITLLVGTRGTSSSGSTDTPVASQVLEKGEDLGVAAPNGERIPTVIEKPKEKLETGLLQNLFEVINPPVDITPTRQPKGATVSFRVPERVPLSAKDKNGHLQRSIYNAAIQVYEPSMGVWATLDTRVDGDVLTAVAPHFSIFQAVWLKTGEQKVGDISVTATPAMSPTEMLWRTGAEYLRQFALNAIGKFDDAKFDCSKRDEDYKVTLEHPNQTKDFDVCVIVKDEGHSTILVKNGWAVPLHLTTNATTGVTADERPADIDLVNLVRNHMGKAVTGGAYASGLDVGSFTLDHETAPDEITVKAETSWVGAAVDVTLAMLTAILPASKLAAQAGPLIDLGNCLAMYVQKNVMGQPGTDVPAKLMETAKTCMVPFVVDELKLGSFASAFAKEARVLPELYQLGKNATMKLVTGKDPAATSADIEYSSGFEEFQGLWTYECGGSYDLFNVADRKVQWTITSYTGDSGSVETKTYTEATLFRKGDKTVLIVDETNMTGLKVGMVADLAVLQGRGAPSVDILFSKNTRFGYTRRGGPSYC